MAAVRSAVDKTMALVVSTNLEQCIRAEQDKGASAEEFINEAVRLLVKSR